MIAFRNALFVGPFLMWWSGLDWRRSFRLTFVLTCGSQTFLGEDIRYLLFEGEESFLRVWPETGVP